MQLIQDRKFAEFWVRGAKKYAQMDEVDQYRYQSMLVWWLILHENIYYQHKKGLLDQDVYTAWGVDLEAFIQEHDIRVCWDNIKGTYQPGFANHVQRLIDEAAAK